jgi:hypothetical protein
MLLMEVMGYSRKIDYQTKWQLPSVLFPRDHVGSEQAMRMSPFPALAEPAVLLNSNGNIEPQIHADNQRVVPFA